MVESASIIRSSSGLVALRTLIAIRRSVDSRFSFSYLSKRLGIKSRSYLSEVLKGTKKLNPKHVTPLVELLALPLAESELLAAKLLLDFGDIGRAEADKLRLAMRDAEKKLESGTVEISDVRDINVVMLVAATLHLFAGGTATRREILDLFRRDRHFEIEKALADLLQNGLFVRVGESFRYSPEYTNLLHLYTATSKKNEIDYLQSSMSEASEHAERFDRETGDSIFYSGLITSEKGHYKESLDFVKQNLRSIQSRIEVNPADTLVRFNIQIYPVVTKPKGKS